MLKNLLKLSLVVFLFVGCEKLTFKNYKIPQNGMYPTIPANSLLFAKMRPYKHASDVKYGDVILFNKYLNNQRYVYTWRIIGLPGDTVTTQKNIVIVNGTELISSPQDTVGKFIIMNEQSVDGTEYQIALDTTAMNISVSDLRSEYQSKTVIVPENEFYTLGDNRFNALDSRFEGTVDFKSIFGKYKTVYAKGKPSLD